MFQVVLLDRTRYLKLIKALRLLCFIVDNSQLKYISLDFHHKIPKNTVMEQSHLLAHKLFPITMEKIHINLYRLIFAVLQENVWHQMKKIIYFNS